MNKALLYIIRFLIGNSKATSLSSLVGYTNDPSALGKYRVVIIPSGFFNEGVYGTPDSKPALPLQEIEGIPLLYGTPQIEMIYGTLVVHADIIASTFFLLTRYEEIRLREIRDEHGRFPGKASLPYKAGFIHRPIVDEYGQLLRSWLRDSGIRVSEPEPRIRKIWLTHDVDAPFYCRTLRHVVREATKGEGWLSALKQYFQPLEKDTYYTFPWLVSQDKSVRNVVGEEHCESLFFLKGGGKAAEDKPHYKLHSSEMRSLLRLWESNHIQIGMHSSYDAGMNPALIATERNNIEKATRQTIRYNRHHFLSAREPEDFEWLEKAGITDDFTMGYADVCGFRLGTSRPVQWINPFTMRLSSLILHPLTIMDVALSESKYMGLDYDEALAYCLGLIERTTRMHGDLVMLWHNDTVSAVSPIRWHRTLYERLIEELKNT